MREAGADFWWIVSGGVLVFVALVASVKKMLFRLIDGEDTERPKADLSIPQLPPASASVPPPPAATVLDEPRCISCGDAASEPMPSIERSRGARDWFRELFAMPPRYRRVVRKETPALCRSHAHVADAMVDEFLHNRVRGAFAAAYTRVAIEASSFEKEFLQKQLTDCLTEDQKRAAKKVVATVTRLRDAASG